MKLSIKRLSPDAVLPKYQTSGSAGFDLHAVDNYVLMPGETILIGTGLAFEFEQGYELQIRPRSGLSSKSKLRVLLGTIDSDYRGEVKVIIENIGHMVSIIDKGDRVAQAVLAPIVQAEIVEVEELGETERGSGGFGHSGK
jgi:dUTP pyrophosphatase